MHISKSTLLLISGVLAALAGVAWLRTRPVEPSAASPQAKAKQYDQAMKAASLAHVRGDLDEAYAHFSRAIEVDPSRAEAYVTRGVVQQQRRRWSDALLDYRHAAEANPEDAVAWNNLAMLLACCPDDEVRDVVEALDYSEHACELRQWRDPAMLHTRAVCLMSNGDWAIASRIVEDYLEFAAPDAVPRGDFDQLAELIERREPYRFSAKP